MKVAGIALGAIWIGFGFFFFALNEHSLVRRIFVGVGFIGAGVYFINYGLTGRQHLFRKKNLTINGELRRPPKR